MDKSGRGYVNYSNVSSEAKLKDLQVSLFKEKFTILKYKEIIENELENIQ